MKNIDYKKTEQDHYDLRAIDKGDESISKDIVNRASHVFYENKCFELCQLKEKGKILDYGCGKGNKHFKFSNNSFKLFGIDISPKSIEFASRYSKQRNLNADYQVMDCENMSFPNDYFDIIFDYGSFSSLDMNKATLELTRVLKKDGIILSIETFGHNPITNFKRIFNVALGKRTRWAAAHIMRKNDWKKVQSSFEFFEMYYFGFFTLFIFPFYGILPKKTADAILHMLEKIDKFFLNISIFKTLAFKTVVVLKYPKKL